ncbi:MFS transporter [Aphanothece hegewaldii CCALA 016]|uniref:MFS transporter n=1 Tax=Aphanothece hegewaldii CCALA 016 TaxID=2107694 RepID=A0A2T1M296_9CHRO|nr:MFS transporter [Aphanothece hegewaldii]PSF38869.1 MFS transporter [Aphanothece hegewaldii CCALA 016]
MTQANNNHSEKLQITTKLAYGTGDFGPAITANILVFYLLFFLTEVAGLSPGRAGLVLMIGKIADAINDPFIGVLSDRTQSKWGRRLPWMLLGAIPFGLIYYLQWLVPRFSDDQNINSWGLFAYYVFIGIVFNLAYTMINLPYQALTPELTLDYQERTNLNSFRFAFSIGGSILSLILYIFVANTYPNQLLKTFIILGIFCSILSVIATIGCSLNLQERGAKPILDNRNKKRVGYISLIFGILLSVYGVLKIPLTGKFDAYSMFYILLGALMGLFTYTFLKGKIETHLCDAQAIEERQQAIDTPSIPFREQLKIAFANKPFLYVIGIYLFSWLAVQLTASILVYFVVSWMRLPEQQSGTVALAVQGTALIMLFFWQWVSHKLDKKVVYFLGSIIWLIAQIGLFTLQPGQVTLMYILAILAGVGVAVAYLIPWSMIPDVIELDELQTGQRREGIFYAFMVLLQKFGLAFGLFIVGIALEAAGFIERIPDKPIPLQPESALFAIRLTVAPLPAVFLICGMILAYFYPITREVHADIVNKLQERRQQKE